MMQAERVSETSDRILEFYSNPGAMTSVGEYQDLVAALPNEPKKLAEVIQGIAIHQYMAPAYGVKIAPERLAESHIRAVDRMLARLLEIDPAPLTQVRAPEKRLIGICHHFALLMVAFLRAKGVPARFRCGFGAFFNAPYFEEHLVCEYWCAADGRWILLDPQLDDVWRRELKFDFNPHDVPRTQFLVASDAWILCRSGKIDPAKVGIFVGNLRGLWFIAGELVRDLAALNNMEMLPWDMWGLIPRPNEELNSAQLDFFDRIAALTSAPDKDHTELRALYDRDEGLRVPAKVFNALLNRFESVLS